MSPVFHAHRTTICHSPPSGMAQQQLGTQQGKLGCQDSCAGMKQGMPLQGLARPGPPIFAAVASRQSFAACVLLLFIAPHSTLAARRLCGAVAAAEAIQWFLASMAKCVLRCTILRRPFSAKLVEQLFLAVSICLLVPVRVEGCVAP